ncbi:MAG: single-stranded DNA-binding protein [Clostridia bacterium]|nr:single-stranded DNA-binding protein [Clostridia bacterium]
MNNQISLIGRIVREPEVKELDGGKKVSNITVAIPRSYKNADGEYEKDYIDVSIWGDMAKNTVEYCKQDDLIGVRGRIESKLIDNEDGTKTKKYNIIAERVSFLSTAKTKREVKETEDLDEPEM